MDEFKESTKTNLEKKSRQEIIDFLGLGEAPNSAELQYKLNFCGELRPWWFEEKKGEVADALRVNYRKGIEGFVDPVTILQSGLKNNFKNPIQEVELIYPRLVLAKDGVRRVPPNAEIINEAVVYLQKIGFNPFENIRGENWILKRKSLPKNEPEKSFSTIYEDIEIKVVRDSQGKAEVVSLCVSG